MRFPEPSETFAAVDLRALTALGVTVSVHALRPAHPWATRLAIERGTVDAAVTAMRRGGAAGLIWGLRHPFLAAGLFGRCVVWGWRRPRHLLAGLLFAPRAMEIAGELEHLRPDVVHLFWGHYPCLVAWLARRCLPGARLSVFLGAYDVALRYPGSASIAAEADAVFTHAQANLPDLEALGIPRARIEVVHRGLDPDLLASPPTAGARVRGRIVLVSRLVAGKGIDDALRALVRLRADLPEVHLLILGDGPERQELEALAVSLGVGGSVSFAGHVSQKQVFAELALAEACLLLSHKPGERLPNAVKEAMACGAVPVVADGPGMTELISDGVDGWIVPARDPVAAAAALQRLLVDPCVRQRMAVRAAATVRERFDVGCSMRRYLAVWRAHPT